MLSYNKCVNNMTSLFNCIGIVYSFYGNKETWLHITQLTYMLETHINELGQSSMSMTMSNPHLDLITKMLQRPEMDQLFNRKCLI